MHAVHIAFSIIILLLVANVAEARNTKHLLPIDDVLKSEQYKSRVGTDVTFQFGRRPGQPQEKVLGEWSTNRRTNALNKTDAQACEWAMLSALISLRDRVQKEGGSAVVNIVSNYRNVEFDSRTQYECHAGASVAVVALKGTGVTRAK